MLSKKGIPQLCHTSKLYLSIISREVLGLEYEVSDKCALRVPNQLRGAWGPGVWGWHPHPGFGGGTPKYKPLVSKNLHSQSWNFPFCSGLYLYFISVHYKLLGLGCNKYDSVCMFFRCDKILIIFYTVKFEPPCGKYCTVIQIIYHFFNLGIFFYYTIG